MARNSVAILGFLDETPILVLEASHIVCYTGLLQNLVAL